MNNNQFRRLLSDKTGKQGEDNPAPKPSAGSALGAKTSSFMPMTPRTVKGGIDVDFARQVRERNAALQPKKQFKSATPKGVKYGAGYTDRARARAEAEEGGTADDKGSRITALEEQMKLGQISVETFEALRDEITGGDIGSTHLVKGLDRRLLERVRRGEDVLGSGQGNTDGQSPPDVDEELDKLGEQEVEAIAKEKVEKKGNIASPPPVAGVKRSRNEIMAELKAQRKAAAEAKAAPTLDTSRWRKVGEKERSRIHVDHKGREVLLTVDEDGIVKKKVRKLPLHSQETEQAAADMPDVSKPVLGADAEIPMQQIPAVVEVEKDNDDIFEGVGTEYDPLGGGDESDSDSNSEDQPSEDETTKRPAPQSPPSRSPGESTNWGEPTEGPKENTSAATHNYFKDAPSKDDEQGPDRLAGVQDLLKRAAKMDSLRDTDTNGEHGQDEDEQAARLKRRAEMLAQQNRDFEDIDMGFGGGRYDDVEDEGEGKKVRLSEWKGAAGANDEGWDATEKDGGKKKRKPKKRKGDANNMDDIMRVIEGRKNASGM